MSYEPNTPDWPAKTTVYKVFVAGIGAVYIGSDPSEVDRMVRKYRDLLKMDVTVEKDR